MSVSPFLSNGIWSNTALPSSDSSAPATERLGAHPLPTKPVTLGRSNSTLSARTTASDEHGRSFDSGTASRLGVIGAQRSSTKPSPDLSRSNSLATSYQSFRSASADLPQPPHLQLGGSTGAFSSSIPSPSFAASFEQSGTELGTPRLFLDSQHSLPKSAPASWLQDSVPSSNAQTPDLAYQRPSSRQGERANGYFPPAANVRIPVSSKRASAQFVSSSPVDSGDMLNAQNLQKHQQTVRSSSPAIALPGAPARGTANLNVPTYMNLSGGLLSPTAATMGSNGPSAMPSPVESGRSSPAHRSVSADHAPKKAADAELAEVPLIKDMFERLSRVEGGMKDFSRQISGISRNVSLLLERTKGLPPSSLSTANASNAFPANTDDVRSLNAQVNALANSVSHLLTLQNMGGVSPSGMPPSPLTGLGTGGPSGAMLAPQTGGLERSTSPRVGGGQFAHHQPFVPQNVTSPRPGVGPRGWSAKSDNTGGDRRWTPSPSPNLRKENSGPGTPQLDETGTGYTQPNAIVCKWEHLNLHTDLLRSILKYGLGPPNKIQQRALPFLLRGSDIIAQAPPTQERIASYVIPALQLVLNVMREAALPNAPSTAGPIALIVSTTVDQATQAQRMALGLGAPLGIRVHIVAGGSGDVQQEAQSLAQAWPHIVVGTPQKMSELFTHLAPGPLNGPARVSSSDVRLVVLDEVDQLIARNLADHVSSMLRVLPPRASPENTGPLDNAPQAPADRQVALFSNTVPQDVLNFAQSIHLRESVRVLVRRDGSTVNGNPSTLSLNEAPSPHLGSLAAQYQREAPTASGAAAGKGLRQYYLYVAVSSASGHSPSASAFSNPAGEMKLELIADLLEDIDFGQVVIYTANLATQEAVVYKLCTRGIEALALNREMNAYTQQQTLAGFRSPASQFGAAAACARKALVVADMPVAPKDVHQIPLVVFYDMPRSVDEYRDKIACATPGARPSVCINVVTASGGPRGDVEMLRTLECQLPCRMAELPLDPKHILNF